MVCSRQCGTRLPARPAGLLVVQDVEQRPERRRQERNRTKENKGTRTRRPPIEGSLRRAQRQISRKSLHARRAERQVFGVEAFAKQTRTKNNPHPLRGDADCLCLKKNGLERELVSKVDRENTVLAFALFHHVRDTESVTGIDNDVGELIGDSNGNGKYHALGIINVFTC